MSDVQPEARADGEILVAAKGGGIAFLGRVFAWGARLLLAVLLAHTLDADGYGLYNLALIIATVVASFPSLGLDSALIRYVAVYAGRRDASRLRGSLEVGIGLPFVLSVVVGLGLFLLAGPIAVGIMHDERLTPLVQIAALLVPGTVATRQLEGALMGLGHIGDAVIAEQFVQPAARAVMLVVLLLIGLTAGWAVAASALAALVATAVMAVMVLRRAPSIRGVAAHREPRLLANHSGPVYFSNIVSTFGGNLQTLFLGALSSAREVGVFAIANQVTMVGSMFHASVVASSMPIFAEMADRQDRSGLERMYRTTSKWTFSLNLPLFFLVLAFPAALLAIFGKGFQTGASALVVLAWGNLINAATGTSGAILDMTGHTRVKLLNSALSVALAIGLNWILIPPMGIVGAALAAVGSIAIVNILRLLQVRLLVGVQPYDTSWLKPIAAGLAAALAAVGVALIAGGPTTIFGFALGALVLIGGYVGAIVALGLSEDDRMVLGRVGRRLTRRRRRAARVARDPSVPSHERRLP